MNASSMSETEDLGELIAWRPEALFFSASIFHHSETLWGEWRAKILGQVEVSGEGR